MDELGRWGKENASASFNFAKPLVDRLVADTREDKMDSFLAGLSGGWGRRERQALAREMPPRPLFRVVAVRHGMGHHNDLGGGLSLFNRDATLNRVGRTQAEAAAAADAAAPSPPGARFSGEPKIWVRFFGRTSDLGTDP